MSFELPSTPDGDKEKMKAALLKHFEAELEGLQESQGTREEDLIEINNIILDLEDDDFDSASLFLEKELERLKERKVKIRGSVSEQDTLRIFEAALIRTQKLWDSLKLEEKE